MRHGIPHLKDNRPRHENAAWQILKGSTFPADKRVIVVHVIGDNNDKSNFVYLSPSRDTCV